MATWRIVAVAALAALVAYWLLVNGDSFLAGVIQAADDALPG